MLRREELRWSGLLIVAAVLVMLHMCPKAAGLNRTINMQPPDDQTDPNNPSSTPRRYNLIRGASFSISCIVTHDDCSFTADFYKDGSVIRPGDLMNAEYTKPRQVSCTTAELRLVFQNFQAAHDGVYYCYASTNDGTEILSDERYLYGSAIPPPAPVLVSPKHIVYYSDESLKLEAQFRGNFFEHYWRHRAFGSTTGTTLMPPDVAITNLGQTYTIAPGSSHHQKGYFEPFLLPASNTFIMPTVENTVVVDDHMRPDVSFTGLQPSYQDGSTVMLTCIATGFPEVNLEFEVTGVAATATPQPQIQSSMSSPYTVTRTLTLTGVSTADCAGRISCTGTNSNRAGMHTVSVPTVIQVEAAPMVTVDPPTPAATVGSPLTLSCSAIDCIRNSFTFEWRLDGVLVSSSRVRSIGSSSSQLTVDSVTTSDYGTYTCSVTNSLGTNVGTFTVVRADANSFVQMHLSTPTTCSTWVESNKQQKLNDVTSSMTAQLVARCSCTFQVLSSQFRCIDDNTVVYQAELHYGLPSDSALPNAVGILSAWVRENPRIPSSSENVQLQVNPSCRVEVTSFMDTTCFPTAIVATISAGAIVGIVLAVAVVIIAVIAASMVVLVFCYRKKVNDYSNLAQQRHQRSRVVMQSNFEMRRSVDMSPKPSATGGSAKETSDTDMLVAALEEQQQPT